MSRIGNRILNIPSNIKITLENNVIHVNSTENNLSINFDPNLVGITLSDTTIATERLKTNKQSHMLQGTINSLINNAIIGLTKGFSKKLNIVGVGYKAQLKDDKLHLALGYSHPIILEIPKEITLNLKSQIEIELKSFDKIKLGQFAFEIRRFRPPEPYKGKGIFYENEKIIRKVGKTSEGGKK